MRRYETIYILRPTLSEDEITEVIEKTNSILCTGEGEIIAIDKWGSRKLAYLIKKESQGYYVFCDHGTDPANVTEMERIFRINDAVMKYMTVKIADSIDTEGIEAARGEYEAAKVAAAEAAEAAEEETQSTKEAPKPKTQSTDEALKQETQSTDEAPKQETQSTDETPKQEDKPIEAKEEVASDEKTSD